jgi:hypothetical protein
MERAKRIELSYAAWEAAVLPLNYARGRRFLSMAGRRNGSVYFIPKQLSCQIISSPVMG